MRIVIFLALKFNTLSNLSETGLDRMYLIWLVYLISIDILNNNELKIFFRQGSLKRGDQLLAVNGVVSFFLDIMNFYENCLSICMRLDTR